MHPDLNSHVLQSIATLLGCAFQLQLQPRDRSTLLVDRSSISQPMERLYSWTPHTRPVGSQRLLMLGIIPAMHSTLICQFIPDEQR
jgi:hypothetical protein